MFRPIQFTLSLLAIICLNMAAEIPIPPQAPRVEHVQIWHGKSYSDPYFWLREKTNPTVVNYLEAENAYTAAVTADLKPFVGSLYTEFLSRINQTDLSVPTLNRGYFYYSRVVEGQQYPILCRRKGNLEALEEVYLDVNELAKGRKFLDIGDTVLSADGQWLAYSIDITGFRQYKLQVKNINTGVMHANMADRVTSFTWSTDGKTLFYVTEDATTKRQDTLWRLEVGGKPELVFTEKDELFRISLARTKDHRYLILTSESKDTWECLSLPANQPKGDFKVLLPREKGHKYDVEHRHGHFFIRTNKGAKNFRIVTVPDSDPTPANWTPFLEGQDDVLVSGLELFKGYAVVTEKHHGLDRFRIHDFASGQWHSVEFPDPTYTASLMDTPEFDSRSFRFNYESLVTPSTVYDYDMVSRKQKLLKQQQVLGKVDLKSYVSERIWATARDGVKVPISLVYKKGLKRDGSAPLFLFGYGSYGFGRRANFSVPRLSLLDRGMVFAIAHIRGGNELGEGWYEDGKLMKKENTFFDFIDCAEFLVREKFTTNQKMVAEGGSAGGMLIGAVANFRPDLFKAMHAVVPFMDVMNTMMDASLPLTVEEYLEWGNPNEKAAFDYMMSYSPYDNLKMGGYPAMMVTTSFNDSQVGYWEPAKYVAKLRALKTDANPLVFKCKMEPAGHLGASGRYDSLRDQAFEYAWMLSQVGIRK